MEITFFFIILLLTPERHVPTPDSDLKTITQNKTFSLFFFARLNSYFFFEGFFLTNPSLLAMSSFVPPEGRPWTWEEVKHVVQQYRSNTNTDNAQLSTRFYRHPTVTKLYKSHLAKFSKLNRFLALKNAFFTDEAEITSGVSFRRNIFPYWFEDGIFHGLVWYLPGTDWNDEMMHRMTSLLPWECLWYENHPHWKSIPELSHWQLIIRVHPVAKVNIDFEVVTSKVRLAIEKILCDRQTWVMSEEKKHEKKQVVISKSFQSNLCYPNNPLMVDCLHDKIIHPPANKVPLVQVFP